MEGRSRRSSTVASSTATSALVRQRAELHEERLASAPRYPKRKSKKRKVVSSQPKLGSGAKAARQPRRWSPKGWVRGGERALCRRSFPAGLEMHHEEAHALAPPSGSQVSWLRSRGTKSIWEQMALADREAARASRAGGPAAAAAAAPRPAPQPEPLAVGDLVSVQFGGARGGHYDAVVAKVHSGGEWVTLDWANGETTQRRQRAANVRRRKPRRPKKQPQRQPVPVAEPAAPQAAPPTAPAAQPQLRPAHSQAQPKARPQPLPTACAPLRAPPAAPVQTSAPPPPPPLCEEAVVDLTAAAEELPAKTPPAASESARVSINVLAS